MCDCGGADDGVRCGARHLSAKTGHRHLQWVVDEVSSRQRHGCGRAEGAMAHFFKVVDIVVAAAGRNDGACHGA